MKNFNNFTGEREQRMSGGEKLNEVEAFVPRKVCRVVKKRRDEMMKKFQLL